jgi:protein phosphatase
MNIVRRLLSSTGQEAASGAALAGRDPIDFASATDVGRRSENQDRCVASSRWGVVSDGVGGHTGGALAAELTVQAVVEQLAAAPALDERITGEAIRRANDAVRAARSADPLVASMGATLTIATARSVDRARSVWVLANVGDSPAWLLTASGAAQLTVEHTVPAELVLSGALPPEALADHPQRHVVTRAIGMGETVLADSRSIVLTAGEWLVLASDGVSDVMHAADVSDVVRRSAGADEAASALVRAALDRGTTDNVTVVALHHRG